MITRLGLFFAAILIGAAIGAQPAMAQTGRPPSANDGPPEASAGAPKWPYRTSKTLYVNRFCTEDEKKLVVSQAEAMVTDTGERAAEARAYYEAMIKRIASENEAANRGDKRAATSAWLDQAALAWFEQHLFKELTVYDPELAETTLARAKGAPVVDCTNVDTYEARRPDFDLVEIPIVPEKLCTQAEIDALRAATEAANKLAKENEAKARHYSAEIGTQYSYYRALSVRADLAADVRKRYSDIAAELLDELHNATLSERDWFVFWKTKAEPAFIIASRMKPAPCGPQPKSGIPAQLRTRINFIRGEPVKFVADLDAFRRNFKGDVVVTAASPNGMVTQEGVAAVDEAIAAVGIQVPSQPLEESATLTAVAQALVDEQGPRGGTGHLFADGTGLRERAKRNGGDMLISESISYGTDAIVRLIVDDGVRGRGHRKMLFAPEFHYIGIACGPHAVYGEMCVFDYSATPDGSPILPVTVPPPPPPPP